ncbi:MAG: T9SS type A sorting domain-containing protein, partial [Mariniphaga sp.]
TLVMNNCTLAGNKIIATSEGGLAVNGGAIYSQGTLLMTNCTLTENMAISIQPNSGGAIYLNSAISTLTNCTLKGNSATSGAGVSINWGTFTILNTIMVDNGTSDYHVLAGITLVDKGYNLIQNQTSEYDPTDIWYFNQTSDILYSHNYSGTVKGSWNRNDAAIEGDLNLSSTLEDNGTVFGTQTLKTTSGSFAIGAGTSSVDNYPITIPQTDQRGALKDGTFDIGAYQYQINTSEADNVWTGKFDNLWGTAGNWTKNTVPVGTENLVIPIVLTMPTVNNAQGDPALCKNITITKGASLIVATGKAFTINGNLVNNNTGSDGLTIKSDNSGTGSMKVLGTVLAGATVERYMSADAWHLISSPTASQPIINFLTDNKDIATSAVSTPYAFAMRGYNTLEDKWSTSFFDDTKPETDLFGVGRGYATLTKSPLTQSFSFKGTLNILPISSISVATGWNLVGNPYTTALNINVGTNSFVSVNSSLLPASYAAVYFWDAAISAYIAVNNDYADTYAPVGQGFFVKAGSAGNISFNSDMQAHDGSPGFKASALPRPTIKLMANNGTGSASTLIKFMDSAREGLDVGYDAGIFKANAEFSVYTKLVEDNGVEFQLQYLPANQYNKLVIPVGIDSKAGGEIVFSVETVQLDHTCKVLLEDKLTNTFTDLSKENYKAAVVANTVGTGRFFLHTGDIVSGLEDQVLDGKLTAYAKSNIEIRVIGEVGDGAVATLVNGLGKVVLTKKLGAGTLNIIDLPNLDSGLYILNIKDKGMPHTIKILIRN